MIYTHFVPSHCDNRLPTGHDEVVLHHTIGLKKMSTVWIRRVPARPMLWITLRVQVSASLICTQKIMNVLLCWKKWQETKVYEQQWMESLGIISKTEAKWNKINELLNYIDFRLTELQGEKEELKEFQEKDKERTWNMQCFNVNWKKWLKHWRS